MPTTRRMREPDLLPFLPGAAGLVMDPARAFDRPACPSGGAGMIGTVAETLALLEALRRGGEGLLTSDLVAGMARDQIPGLAIDGAPGLGFGLGFSVLRDPLAAGVPETGGAWRWGGAYGHSWWVDPAQRLTVVAFTNTALEGMSAGGRFPADLSRAVYAGMNERS